MIVMDPEVCKAIREELIRQKAPGVIRIELMSTGCCDASLGMRVDAAGESDLVVETGGLTFVMSMDTYDLVGRVTITCRGKDRFVLSSEKPVSEWDGFCSCSIKV